MRRAVITGLGAVTPIGNDVPTTWSAMLAGRSGIDRITTFDADAYPVNIAGEVRGFDPTVAMSAKDVRRSGREVHMGVAAALEAVADADYAVEAPPRTGVILGSCVGGMAYTLEQQRIHDDRGPDRVSPHWIPNMLPDTTSSFVATAIGARGLNYGISSACSTSTHAIGDAMEVIRRDQADVIVAGGTEAVILPVVMAGFCAMRALVDGRDDPPAASRPFDLTRGGFVLSEGAAAVVVEELEHARARGARIYCEVAGYGVSNDAYHVATPHPESLGVIEMIESALARAGIAREEVDYVNAHGTSTPYNDVAETRALKAVFGEHAHRMAISSTKSMVGHSFGAAGAIEAVATALTIHHGRIPPTINLHTPDPECDLDYVPNQARDADVRVAVSNSMGLGGHNGCVILRAISVPGP
jgi:3-oxoacyl-[acyl-carrier-protein] synthase II